MQIPPIQIDDFVEELSRSKVDVSYYLYMSTDTMQRLRAAVHNRLVDQSVHLNSAALMAREMQPGHSVIREISQVLPHNVWRRLDRDVLDDEESRQIGTLEMNMDILNAVLTARLQGGALLKHVGQMALQRIAPPSFSKMRVP